MHVFAIDKIARTFIPNLTMNIYREKTAFNPLNPCDTCGMY